MAIQKENRGFAFFLIIIILAVPFMALVAKTQQSEEQK